MFAAARHFSLIGAECRRTGAFLMFILPPCVLRTQRRF